MRSIPSSATERSSKRSIESSMSLKAQKSRQKLPSLAVRRLRGRISMPLGPWMRVAKIRDGFNVVD